MKRIYISLLILVVLIGIAVYLFITRGTGTLKRADRDFAVRDTSMVYLVEFTEGDQKLTLKKEGQTWRVNGEYPVQRKLVKGLLVMLSSIDVSAPVPNSMYNEVYANLKETSKRIMILQENKSPKVYYIFYDMNSNATYMLLEHSTNPFRMQIPGYSAKNLNALYRMDKNYWRDNTIFRLAPHEIVYVSVNHFQHPEKSFEIEKMGDRFYQVRRLFDSAVIDRVNMENLINYLSSFNPVPFEKILNNLEDTFVDSLLSSSPDKRITVTDIYGNRTVIKTFTKYHTSGDYSREFDYNRQYAEINENREIVLVKYIDIDPIFKYLSYFETN